MQFRTSKEKRLHDYNKRIHVGGRGVTAHTALDGAVPWALEAPSGARPKGPGLLWRAAVDLSLGASTKINQPVLESSPRGDASNRGASRGKWIWDVGLSIRNVYPCLARRNISFSESEAPNPFPFATCTDQRAPSACSAPASGGHMRVQISSDARHSQGERTWGFGSSTRTIPMHVQAFLV